MIYFVGQADYANGAIYCEGRHLRGVVAFVNRLAKGWPVENLPWVV
jgi:hypothetical protein